MLEVTPLYMEPLQFLVKEELYESVSKDFGQLRGKSIDLDNPNSATNLMASELLRFMGLTNQAGQPQYQPVYIPQLKLAENTAGISLPDAIFQIGGVPSESIRNLIVNYHYRLVQLPFGTPFNLDKFRDAENPNSLAHSTLRLDKRSIEEAVIPAYVYSVLPPVPPVDTRTIATRLTMIGSDRLDSHVVHQILELVLSPQVGSFAKPPLTDDLLNSTFQFERHPGTDQYLKSLKPVDVEGAFTAYSRLGEIWGLVITVYIGAASGLKSWRNRRVAQRGAVADFLKQVLEVETEAGPSCSDAERISLDQRLSDIKKASIQLHLDGRLEDPEELPSLLVSLADTRTRIWRRAS